MQSLTVQELVAKYLPEVEGFLEKLQEAEDEDSRNEEYRRISKLVRFAQRFYELFLGEAFEVEVTSFAFSDKRLVAEKIREKEENREADELKGSALDLAYAFLDICDQLHGELDFGYSVDTGDFVEFHEETFPAWLDELSDWLCNVDEDLAEKVKEISKRYRDVV